MTAQAQDRLAPHDFYVRLDWLRDHWTGDEDEARMTRRLQYLRRLFEHLPTRFWDRARPLLSDLGEARLVEGEGYFPLLRSLGEIVSEWDRSRPPLLECSECGLAVRGHDRLAQHRSLIHEVSEASPA